MSKSVSVIITDDLDGSANAETISFGLDGVAYEIDLSKKNRARLERALAPFIEAGRRAPRPGRRRGASRAGGSAADRGAARAWARAAGLKVSERGRISADIMRQYNALPPGAWGRSSPRTRDAVASKSMPNQPASDPRQRSWRASGSSEAVLSVAERVLEDLAPHTSRAKRAIVARRVVRQADRQGLRKAEQRRKLITQLAPKLAPTHGRQAPTADSAARSAKVH